MKDFLLDIVDHTLTLGCIDTIKVTGDDKSTVIEAISDDKSVILKAKFKQANASFSGTFGMPNLAKLKTILDIPEYKENAVIELSTREVDGETVPAGLHFENASGDFKNDYRYMALAAVNQKVRSVKFKGEGVTWNVDFVPTLENYQRFRFQVNANAEEKTFIAKTENNNLKFYFGDHSTHAGNFVFHSNVSGNITKGWNWPVLRFLSILALQGDKKMRFSDEGVAEITVDSGLIEYSYIIPAQTK